MIDYKYEIEVLSNAISELSNRHKQLVEEFQSICEHTNVTHTKKYYSGGYDYSAETAHTYICQDCGNYKYEVENHNSGFE